MSVAYLVFILLKEMMMAHVGAIGEVLWINHAPHFLCYVLVWYFTHGTTLKALN
jgi:hypothetical protein